jgi:hypothetical protein
MARQAFQDLVWPAVAGNVTWSFFTLLIGPSPVPAGDPASLVERIFVLLLLSGYLIGDWLRTHGENRPAFYWLFDGLHLTALTAFAIGAATGQDFIWLRWSLTALLGITAFGHALKAFGESRGRRFAYAVANALGIPVAWFANFEAPWLSPDGSQLPLAVLTVLVLWLFALWKYPRQKAA